MILDYSVMKINFLKLEITDPMIYKLLLIIDESSECPYVFVNKEFHVYETFKLDQCMIITSVDTDKVEIVPLIKEIRDFGNIVELITVNGKYVFERRENFIFAMVKPEFYPSMNLQ
jgi:hypothetical protein